MKNPYLFDGRNIYLKELITNPDLNISGWQ